MPFQTLPHGVSAAELDALEAYPSNLPEPLVAAILHDPMMEREGRTTAILVHGFVYEHEASGARIEVPESFITDFASIPQVVQFAIPPFGRHAKAAVLHDWLYAIGELGKRDFADRIFIDAMAELAVDPKRRAVMHQAVRLFGGGGYEQRDRAWSKSWGNWRTGEYTAAPSPRSDYFQEKWPKPPRNEFRP